MLRLCAFSPITELPLSLVQSDIQACRACVTAGFIPEARPVFRGVCDRRWMIVGQAPAMLGHERPAYSGAAGVKLRSWLTSAGLEGPDPLEDNFYLTSVTKCFPGSGTGGKGDRMPSPAEVALCAPHLQREIDHVRPEVVVTLGKLAANVLVGPGALADLVGTIRTVTHGGQTFTLIPFPHPSGVSRWLNDEPGRTRLRQGIARLSELHAASPPRSAER